jgi:hypothetical protein
MGHEPHQLDEPKLRLAGRNTEDAPAVSVAILG